MPKTNEAPVRRGWAWPLNSKKAHYFMDARSLCRKWLFFGEVVEDGNDNSPDACVACKRLLAREKGKDAALREAGLMAREDGG